MRNLTAEEWVVVSGGHPSANYDSMQEVVVNGQRVRWKGDHPPWWLYAAWWVHAPIGARPADYHDYHDYYGGGGDSGEDTPQKPPEEKPKQDHKIDPCKLGAPVDHLVPPKGLVASKAIGASDIVQAWDKALGKFSNADLQAIKSGLEEIRNGLPSATWYNIISPDPATALSAGYAVKINKTIGFIDQALAAAPEQRYQFASAIGLFIFEHSESKYFSFLQVKSKFKGSCGG